MRAFAALFQRDLLVALRRPTDAANPLVFFVLAVLLLGVGAASAEKGLGGSAAGAVWVLALFANLLAVEGVFRRDVEDGTLEQLLIHARPRFAAVLGKLAANWSCAGLPVLVLSPLAVYVLGHSTAGAGMVMLTLLLGTPTLTLLGAIGAALTAGTGRGGLLLAVLVMPFYLPVLIFGAGASTAAGAGGDAAFELLVLGALLTGSITAAPFAVGKALAISQEY
ncbi:MAG: heme exporter protein CcmB [Gammaproteobacteria bacterium]|nr:heme exporter protein CcmB [Gammaproteobacteria bacterium]